MQPIFDMLALAVAGAASATLVLSVVFFSRWRRGVPVAMDLWTAGGLLHMAGDTSWTSIATAVVIVLIREVVVSRKLLFG